METILELLERANTTVFVKLPDAPSGTQFMQEAERAGFLFGDGVKPTERECTRIMALHSDRTICYVGICGHIAFGCHGASCGDRQIICLQYQNAAAGFLIAL